MKEILALALSAIVEGLKLANTESARKYVDEVLKIQLKIIAEEGKGYDSDDPKLETLYKQLAVTLTAAKGELSALAARNSSK